MEPVVDKPVPLAELLTEWEEDKAGSTDSMVKVWVRDIRIGGEMARRLGGLQSAVDECMADEHSSKLLFCDSIQEILDGKVEQARGER